MTSYVRISTLIVATCLMTACGEKPAPVSPVSVEPAPAAGGMPVAGRADSSAALTVVEFSPNTTIAGTPFNVQTDGQSGISFVLSRSAPAAEFTGWFDSKPLSGLVVSKTIVTATIPAEYLATPGSFPVELDVGGVRLPAGTFVIKPR